MGHVDGPGFPLCTPMLRLSRLRCSPESWVCFSAKAREGCLVPGHAAGKPLLANCESRGCCPAFQPRLPRVGLASVGNTVLRVGNVSLCSLWLWLAHHFIRSEHLRLCSIRRRKGRPSLPFISSEPQE